MSFYDIEVTRINGEQQSMADFKGKVLLIVNTASKCGYTPQYEGLQKLYEAYREQGLEILGFPCNQFMNQEPGSEEEIAEFCKLNHGVTFPMFAKVDVNGSGQHPLYKHLTAEAPGLLGSKAVKWNFTKFLVDREGKTVKRFAPADAPESLESEIKSLL
ncbi:glutathione peroxidase [Paenibacillus tarimensis]|uniref:glutathione peroxidase n=1 Tax=Paenibacillus tarimensis TaxID=416012 RepID=UPI001F2DC274|nr:glutathione peroxidase [Paenibacillus tarimensis]MCF2942902.1 glutathione peroxidase [Paenibacillus tarimensis]